MTPTKECGLRAITLGVLTLGTLSASAGLAQDNGDATTAQAADAVQGTFEAISSGWVSRCNATSRDGGLSCELEIRIGLQADGRQITRMTVQQGPDLSQPPGVVFQLPHGLFNPAGLRLSVDNEPAIDLPIQTCDAVGCYAGTPLTEALEAELSSGERLTVTFQDLSGNDIAVPVVLDGFKDGLDAIR